MGEQNEVLKEVLDRVTPSREERKRVNRTVEKVKEIVLEVGSEMGVEVEPRTVGSVARGTWTSGDRDIDIFILLPKDLDIDRFREIGLELARETASYGDEYKEEFAEHPYITARYGEFEVDIVPCYDVDSHEEVASAVDRTPLHDEYLSKRLDNELRDSIRLLKRFMKGLRVYGAEFKVGGFSGYLTELIALNYKSDTYRLEENNIEWPTYINTLENASNWSYGDIIDIEGYGGGEKFDGSLVVVDPVDPDRNVAAALRKNRWAEFIAASYKYLRKPGYSYFYPPKPKIHTEKQLKRFLKDRDTKILLISFEKPDVVDDTLYPQLRKTSRWIKSLLEKEGFNVLRTAVNGENGAYVLVEIKEKKLPLVEKHYGPPVTSKDHSKKFIDKYIEEKTFSGPYIEGDRWVVERERKYNKPKEIIEENIEDAEKSGLGKNLMETEYSLIEDEEVAETTQEFLSEYLEAMPNWLDE